MKAILMSIRPPHTCNILNLIKLLEIRKKFPKDYVGWVYIYCTKNGGMTYKYEDSKYHATTTKNYFPHYCINAKVVARFWCDKVVEFWNLDNIMLAESCLSKEELGDYLGFNKGYAIHITNLEIFEKPKSLSEFGTLTNKCNGFIGGKKPLTRAPQSWCYVEV